ncbi:MAG: phosphotransferase family protein [Acidimicrobiales bacterium]
MSTPGLPSEVAITEAQARDVLAEACPTTRIARIDSTTVGHTSRQWLARTDEGDLLVKFPARDLEPERTRAMIYATRIASEAGVPVVRFRAFLPVSHATGTPVVVQEFVAGERASDVWPSLDEARRREVAGQFGTAVGRVHLRAQGWFGDVLGATVQASPTEFIAAQVHALLAQVPTDLVPLGRAALADVFDRCIERLDPAISPSLVHGDLWWENVLLDGGSFHRLLDFEHARFGDRFSDFGKLDELVFHGWPSGRASFVERYEDLLSAPDDATLRTHLTHGYSDLSMYVYFARWTPKWVPVYSERLDSWMKQPAP